MKKTLLISLLALLSLNSVVFSQDSEKKYLTINVKDANNKPVPFAVILLDNVRQKRWTNSKGRYTIKVKEYPKQISAYSPKIGIKTVKFEGNNKINIKIQEGTDKSKLFTDIRNKGRDPIQFRTIYDYIRGQVPGVNIDADNRITIRGYNSINGSTTPLFILNNNQVSQGTFETVVPTVIRSIEVLKGPEAARYGSRGANGVIIVSTY